MNRLLATPARICFSLAVGVLLLAGTAQAADDTWGPWPKDGDPQTIGTRVTQNLLDRKGFDGGRSFSYLETCSGYGAVRFAAALDNHDLLDKVFARYQTIITPEGTHFQPKSDHVDRGVFGILPLEMYRVSSEPKDSKYLDLGVKYADSEFATLDPDGLSFQTRYYVDDVYKISVMQIQAFRLTKKTVYADQAVKEMLPYIDRFQQPDGLYFHGTDGKVYWGRGDGWMAAALAEVLMYLPTDNASYGKIMDSYKKMMAGLLKVQAPDGRWRQVLNISDAWEESSCTGYFTFAMGVGVNHGWLDSATYRPAVKKAWTALVGELDDKANVKEVGVLTEHSNDPSYYLQRPKADGNLHGQFATLWAAWALLEQKPAAKTNAKPAATTETKPATKS